MTDPVSPFAFEALDAGAVVARGPSPADTALDQLARARAEAEQLRAGAHAEGFETGRAEALDGLAPAAAALAEGLAAARADAAATAARLEGEAVELGLALAEKVVGAALEARPELVLEAVRGALRGIAERERLTILVNPADMPLVGEALAGLRGELGGIEHCEVHAERRVARGGAVVRHLDGDVDAGVATKLARAREVVAAALAEAAGV